jgi:hypothetical protein
MKEQKALKGFKTQASPLASAAELAELLLKKDYVAAERILRKERKKSERAAKRYVESLVEQAR